MQGLQGRITKLFGDGIIISRGGMAPKASKEDGEGASREVEVSETSKWCDCRGVILNSFS